MWAMPCPVCERIIRDEALVSEAVEDCRVNLRYALTPEEREAVLEEERLLATLLSPIEERRAASAPNY